MLIGGSADDGGLIGGVGDVDGASVGSEPSLVCTVSLPLPAVLDSSFFGVEYLGSDFFFLNLAKWISSVTLSCLLKIFGNHVPTKIQFVALRR